MASSGNFPVLNILYRGQRGTSSSYYPTIIEGSTKLRSTDNQDAMQITTFEGLKSGKWYWEWILISPGGDRLIHSGAADSNRANWDYASASSVYGAEKSIHFHTYNQIMKKDGSDTGNYSSSASSHADDDVFGFALDVDNGKAYIHKNGTYYASGNPASGSNPGATWTTASEYTDGFTPYFTCAGGTDADGVINFGQNSTFGGRITAGGNADGNGFGNFKHSPPTGFLAVCAANLPISDDIDPAQTDDDYPAKQFNVITYTGNGGVLSVTGLGFKPDLVWGKMRSPHTYNNMLYDSSRGANQVLQSDTTNAEIDISSANVGLRTFDSDGFTIGSEASLNDSGDPIVAWCWRANGGTTSSNSSGDITSTVQANTKGGFSIVTYTGNGSVAQSIGHGLSSGAPEFILVKNRSQADAWAVYHVGTGNAAHLILDTADAQVTSSAYWGSFTPTTTLFKVGSDHKLNASSENYVAYLWHGVEGYSKFGTYEGNGNNGDGPFVYTGFRPRLLFIKDLDAGNEWYVQDTARETHNPTEKFLEWDTSDTEQSKKLDILSNGFKPREDSGRFNDTHTYIYGAWGDVPFKYNNTF